MEALPETTYFVFVEEEIDKRSKLYKAVGKCGNAIEFGKQTDETLMKWVGGRISREGKNITQAAYQSFIAKTGTDMQNIEKELEKLLCYTMGKTCTDRSRERSDISQRRSCRTCRSDPE